MSFLTRLWRSLGTRSRYVGRDLEGNRYYENPSSSDGKLLCIWPNSPANSRSVPLDPRRTKRTVQYGDSEAVWEYIGGGKRLPVQWSSWLTHTRHFPPTLEELQADLARQQRVLANVRLIEAREQQERIEMQRLNTGAVIDHPFERQVLQQPPSLPYEHPQAPDDSQTPSVKSGEGNTLPKMPSTSDAYEPQTWTPRARGRGS